MRLVALSASELKTCAEFLQALSSRYSMTSTDSPLHVFHKFKIQVTHPFLVDTIVLPSLLDIFHRRESLPWLTQVCRCIRLTSFIASAIQSASITLLLTHSLFLALETICTFPQGLSPNDTLTELSQGLPILPPPDLMPSKIRSDPTILLHRHAVNIRMYNQYYTFYILKSLSSSCRTIRR